jgi:tetratricopeptide (TPR) repeat protein
MAKDDGKLGSLLGLLDAAAWERLLTFMQSAWFNRSEAVRALLEVYFKAWQQGKALPEEEEIFGKIFSSEVYDGTKLKNLRAALQRKLDSFLAQEAYTRDESLQCQLLLRQLNVLGESRYFPKYEQRAIERIDSLVVEEREIAEIRRDDRSQAEGSHGSYHHALQFFQLLTLRFLVRQANHGAIVGFSVDTAQAESMLPMIDAGPGSLPALQLYRSLLDVFRNPTERPYFLHFQGLLTSLGTQLAARDATDLYTGAINHCIRRINAGEADFATMMLALYQEMDRRDLLLLHGRIPATQFKNMVGLALRFQEFAWAQMVIDRYGRLLDQDPHGNAEAFNQGMLHFTKGDFEAAERCFNLVLRHFDDIFFGLDARSFLLRVYCETDNWTGLESLAESFKMYLKRNKRIPKAHRESYLHTARFFGKLSKLETWRSKDFLKLRDEVARTAFAATSKQWLLQKIDGHLAKLGIK